MTWREYIECATQRLAEADVEDAKTNAEYLAAHVLGLKHKSDIRYAREKKIAYNEAVSFSALVFRRQQREPLQYILKEWEFFGLPMRVGPGALIPRPETELLVEEALREAASITGKPSILDLGTGSGAIALALASKCPGANIRGIDVNREALKYANGNAAFLGINTVRFQWGDILSPTWPKDVRRYDLIVSNPPYVSQEDFEKLEPELRYFEPREALTDGSTGFTFYERIAALAPKLLKRDGRLVLELGFGISERVSGIMRSQGIEVLRVVDDLARIPRVLVGRIVTRHSL